MIAARILAALRRVGQEAVLLAGDGSSPAFVVSIQPHKALPPEDADPLGAGRNRRYTLYAPPLPVLRGGSRVVCGGSAYLVLSSEELRLAGEVLYQRAVVELEGEDPRE